MRGTLTDRFIDKILVMPNGCWDWQAHLTNGYGNIREGGPGGGEYRKAHRIAMEIFGDGPVPDGLEVDHLCRNTRCVNPSHLEAVTHRENILRGDSPAALHARQERCSKGHSFSTENTYLTATGSRECRICRREADRRRNQRTLAATGRQHRGRRKP